MSNLKNLDELIIDIQIASQQASVPDETVLIKWAQQCLLMMDKQQAELTIRVVERTEIQALNLQYRKKDKPTNVLSFPAELPEGIELPIPLLGDILICAEVVAQEAEQQAISIDAHWAHMIVHGILHLLGYDHIQDQEAEKMEAKEIEVLTQLGFESPYE